MHGTCIVGGLDKENKMKTETTIEYFDGKEYSKSTIKAALREYVG